MEIHIKYEGVAVYKKKQWFMWSCHRVVQECLLWGVWKYTPGK